MARVFLSHSSRDNDSARRMKAWLEEQGFDAPFLDFDKHSGIPPGSDWEKILYREIELSQALLILQSANWNASKWCDREFTCARFLGKPIFQVIETADGDPGPSIARDLQVLDLRQEREAGLGQLRKQLAAIALTAQGGFSWDGTRPPYPGLLSFEEADAPIYFGRDEDIHHLIERLTARRTLGGPRLLVLLGASGAGKSSLLRAGVLPRLRRSGRGWLVVPPFRPQGQPCQELARALALAADRGADWRDLHRSLVEADSSESLPAVLAQIASDLRMSAAANEAHILLSIDQGEELFGALEQEEVQRFFRILTAAMGADLPFLGVVTLRSEFLGRLQAAEKDGLTARFEEVSLAPLPMAQIPAIIKGPARVAGLEVEEGFVQQAAADAETEDALPLLAFALRELYERFGRHRHLTLSFYQALGNAQDDLSPLENAVRRRADEVLTGMHPSEHQMNALRDAFVPAMVRFEQGNYVRRPARWDALPPEAQPLLEQLVNARLLISHQEENGSRLLEVAHEALLRKWPLLRGWLDQDREFLIGSQQLEQDLQDWQKASEQQRPAALLTPGLKLQRAKAWLNERPQQLSVELRDFVQASSDQEEAKERKARRNRRLVMGGLSGLTALAVAGGGIAWWREREAQVAQFEQYEANHRALLNISPLESVIYGLAALEAARRSHGASLQLSYTLEQAITNNRERAVFTFGNGRLKQLVVLPNGHIATVDDSNNDSIKIWSQDGVALSTIKAKQGQVSSLVALPNGDLLSSGYDGSIKRWNKEHKVLSTIKTRQDNVFMLAVLSNGDLISRANGSIKRWSKDGMSLVRTMEDNGTWIVPLPNGEMASSTSTGDITRWSMQGQVLATLRAYEPWGDVLSLVALPNGELAAGVRTGSIVRWSKDLKALTPFLQPNEFLNNKRWEPSPALSLLALHNGELVSGGGNGVIKRWSREGKVLVSFRADQGAVIKIAILPNGELLSGGSDGTIKRWSIEKDEPKSSSSSFYNGWETVALPNGEIASISMDRHLITRWSKDGTALTTIRSIDGTLESLVARPNGELISGGSDGIIYQWSKDGKLLLSTRADNDSITALALLPNGDLMSRGENGSIKRWSKDGKLLLAINDKDSSVNSLVVLPNGDFISEADDGKIKRWSKNGRPRSTIRTAQYTVNALVGLANGELISGGSDGSIKRWSKDGKLLTAINDKNSSISSLVVLPNGELISGGFDGKIKRWSKHGTLMASIPTRLAHDGDWVSTLVALPNGDLLSMGSEGNKKLWSLESVAKRGCFDLRDHSVLLHPQSPPQWAARDTCRRLGVLKGK